MTRFIVMQFALSHKCSPLHLRVIPLRTTISFSFAVFCLFLSDYREIAAFSYAQEASVAVSQASFGPPAIAEHPDILFVESRPK